MISLSLAKKGTEPLTVLCLGAHSDDIEIGCGGTLLQLKTLYGKLRFHWVVFSAAGVRGPEAAKAAGLFTGDCDKRVVLKEYRDGFLPYNGEVVKDEFEKMKAEVNPDVIGSYYH